MITVNDLLTLPLFQNFQLVSGDSGLYNNVTGTGIFEWETVEDIDATFEPGEFVMTTLSSAKYNPSAIDVCLKALIEKGVAAIAVKTIYYSSLPKDLIHFANERHVPVFTFSETFFDDIIFAVKNALLTDDLNPVLSKKLDALLGCQGDEGEQRALALEINPVFYDNIICCCCVPLLKAGEKKDTAEAIDDYFKYYQMIPEKNVGFGQVSYSLIKQSYGIVLILTDGDETADLRERLLLLLSHLEIHEGDFNIGIGQTHKGLEYLKIAVNQAIYALAACTIDQQTLMDFKNIGLLRFLSPLRNDPWVEGFYKDVAGKLTDYDSKHNSNLLETLLSYVHNDGDISRTAEELFQHGNTIRYRLDKIKHILHIQDAADYYSQLFVFAKLYELRRLLDDDT